MRRRKRLTVVGVVFVPYILFDGTNLAGGVRPFFDICQKPGWQMLKPASRAAQRFHVLLGRLHMPPVPEGERGVQEEFARLGGDLDELIDRELAQRFPRLPDAA